MIRPATNRVTRNVPSLITVVATSLAENEPEVAKPESNAIMIMARISSTIRMPKISVANFSFVLPRSSSALTMIVVDEIERIAPRKMQSMVPQPKARPTQ
jgi:hypothetical protein